MTTTLRNTGLIHVRTISFTGSSSVNIDNCFGSTYTHYYLRTKATSSDAIATMYARFRSGGVTESGNNYVYQWLFGSGTTIYSQRGTQNFLSTTPGYLDTSSSTPIAETWLFNPFEAVRTTMFSNSLYSPATPASMQYGITMYAHLLTNSYDGINIFPSSGTMTGTISIFGLYKP